MNFFIAGISFSLLCHFADALLANIFSAIGNQASGRAAEDAGRLKLLQNDPVILHIDLQFVPFGNIQRTPQFNRQNDSSQIINFTNNTSRFHYGDLPLKI